MMSQPFQFLDTPLMIDGELELVEPSEHWIDPLLASCHHPLTQQQMPAEAAITRESILRFLGNYPRGHQPADCLRDSPPTYYFWMRLRPEASPAIPIAGGLGLRIGDSDDLRLYLGHIGYHVYPGARGRHYALRACRLVLPLARRHGMNELWITCNPDNLPSRRTCEALGGQMVETVRLPDDHPLFLRGDRLKCRYRIPL